MKNSVLKDLVTVSLISVLAKIVAFMKSVIQASSYGVNIHTDAYNMAWGVVGDVLYLFTTALAVAFVPIYIQKKTNEGTDVAKEFVTKTITFMLILAGAIILVLEIIAPGVMRLFAPSYEGEILAESVSYFRILVIGFAFSLITSIYQNLLNSERVYGFASICSVINSVVLIAIILLFSKSLDVWALVIAVPLSYLCQFFVLYRKGRKYGRISFKYGIKDEALKLIALQAIPVLISQATVEINQAVDRALLTGVEEGAVTSVSYSVTLYQFVSGIIILPLSTVLFTELSEAGAKNNREEMQRLLDKVFKIVVLVCLPIMLITVFTSLDIVNIVYGHGKFDSTAICQTAEGLFAYIFCLIPATVKSIISRAYYALNDTRRPMIIGVLEVVTNIGLSILLVRFFGILGVVGATAIATIIFSMIMLMDFKLTYTRKYKGESILEYWKIVTAGVCAGVMLYALKDITFMNSLVDFVLKAIMAMVFYLVVLIVTKDKIILETLGILKGKLKKDKTY